MNCLDGKSLIDTLKGGSHSIKSKLTFEASMRVLAFIGIMCKYTYMSVCMCSPAYIIVKVVVVSVFIEFSIF